MSTIEANGAKLEYIDMGQGEPVVFVHGSLGDLRSWGQQIDPFSKRYRAIAYSRRYHYPNAWQGDGQDYSTNLHAEDLASLINNLGLQRSHIVGSSYGAYTALILAARHPELVRSLTLGEPPILPWLEGKKECAPVLTAFATNAWEPSKRAFQRGDMEEGVRSFINGVLGDGAFDKLPREVRAMMMDNAPEMRAETSSPVYFSEFTCDDARKIKAPTLLLTGELSPPMFRHIIKELKRCMHEADCSAIPRSSHMMQAGNPEAFNARVMGFISRHEALDG